MDDQSSHPSAPVSLWAHKPWWCQPWSILATGIGISGGSWLLGHRLWLTIPITGGILLWWNYFLIIYPRLFRQMMEQSSDSPR